MSQRNPTNDRNLNGGPEGQTRKSAASAKPKRQAAESVRVVKRGKSPQETKAEKKAREARAREKEDQIYSIAAVMMKKDPTYVKFKRIWWIFIGLAIALTIAAWLMQLNAGLPSWLVYGTLIVAYAAIIGTFALDMAKIRPIRREMRARAVKLSKKATAALVEEEIARQNAVKAARQRRKERLLGMVGIKKKADAGAGAASSDAAGAGKPSAVSSDAVSSSVVDQK